MPDPRYGSDKDLIDSLVMMLIQRVMDGLPENKRGLHSRGLIETGIRQRLGPLLNGLVFQERARVAIEIKPITLLDPEPRIADPQTQEKPRK